MCVEAVVTRVPTRSLLLLHPLSLCSVFGALCACACVVCSMARLEHNYATDHAHHRPTLTAASINHPPVSTCAPMSIGVRTEWTHGCRIMFLPACSRAIMLQSGSLRRVRLDSASLVPPKSLPSPRYGFRRLALPGYAWGFEEGPGPAGSTHTGDDRDMTVHALIVSP